MGWGVSPWNGVAAAQDSTTQKNADIHASSGVRTHDPSIPAAATRDAVLVFVMSENVERFEMIPEIPFFFELSKSEQNLTNYNVFKLNIF
jgi:hypothetical protein